MSASKTTHVKYFKEIFAIVNIDCPLKRIWNHLGNKALGRSWGSSDIGLTEVGRLALNTGEHYLWAGIPEWIKRRMWVEHRRLPLLLHDHAHQVTALMGCHQVYPPQHDGETFKLWVRQTFPPLCYLCLSWQLDKRPIEHLEVFL